MMATRRRRDCGAATVIGILACMAVLLALSPVASEDLGLMIPFAPVPREDECRAELERKLPSSTMIDRERYRCKPDFAWLEHRWPLTNEMKRRLAADFGTLLGANQEQLDQIYARLTAGPIPDGRFDVALFGATDAADRHPLPDLLTLLPSDGQVLPQVLARLAPVDVGRRIWRQNIFRKADRLVWTRVADEPALFDALLPILQTTIGFEAIDQGRHAGGAEALANVYCGQSLLDGRRESIVLDYRFVETPPSATSSWVTTLLGERGLQARSEMRWVSAGVYLGRVYFGRFFAFNFLLIGQSGGDAEPGEDCWPMAADSRAAIRSGE